jgi:hypothetical protein
MLRLGAHPSIDRTSRSRIAQHTGVVDERLRPGIRGHVQLDQEALYIVEVALERVQEAARLQVFRRRTATASKTRGTQSQRSRLARIPNKGT